MHFCNPPNARQWRHLSSTFLVAACIVSIPASGLVLLSRRSGNAAPMGRRIGAPRPPRKPWVNRQNKGIPVDTIMLYSLPRVPEQTNNMTDSNPFDEQETTRSESLIRTFQEVFLSFPMRSILFSFFMGGSGAILGPFLDSYHSLFGVLQYDAPVSAVLWGADAQHPALITTDWVPGLFGLAGFLIGWLYILFDAYFDTNTATSSTTKANVNSNNHTPSPPKILLGIALFTFQYWWSGILYHAGVDRTVILFLMTLSAAFGFRWLDNTRSGFITSSATAIGGPLIEVVLLTLSRDNLLFDGKGYHYNDLGETGFFPLWIVPVYFFGGPANGNLARGFWQALSSLLLPQTEKYSSKQLSVPCDSCNSTRCVACPNCDGIGNYKAMGDRIVSCKACHGRGFVICRDCFDKYNEDPYDIESIRELMSRMPD